MLLLDDGALTPGLLKWFRELGLKFFFIDYVQLIEQGRVCLRGPDDSTLSLGDVELRLRDVAAVIGRGPLPIRAAPEHDDVSRAIFWDRWTQLLLDLRGVLSPSTIWLPSHPLNGHPEWQNKFGERAIAERAGLDVPDAICTNDAAQARAFVRRHRGRVLLKDSSLRGQAFAITPIARGETFEHLRASPTVLEQRIDKAHDVRAVFVGDSVLAAKIHSQDSPRAKLDWRVYDDARVKWEQVALPRKVERATHALLQALELRWASVDFAVGKDGKHYFLEANRPGACFWLLPYAGLDVPKQIATYLRAQFR